VRLGRSLPVAAIVAALVSLEAGARPVWEASDRDQAASSTPVPAYCSANHKTWDLINKNLQLVVSGLFYWSVEDFDGNIQIGKLVVIM
jgi:hypothetical protein